MKLIPFYFIYFARLFNIFFILLLKLCHQLFIIFLLLIIIILSSQRSHPKQNRNTVIFLAIAGATCLWLGTWANSRTLAYYPRLSMQPEGGAAEPKAEEHNHH